MLYSTSGQALCKPHTNWAVLTTAAKARASTLSKARMHGLVKTLSWESRRSHLYGGARLFLASCQALDHLELVEKCLLPITNLLANSSDS